MLLRPQMIMRLCVNEFVPVESWRKYKYINEIAVPARVVLFTHSDGKMNMVFLWKTPAGANTETFKQKYQNPRQTVSEIACISHACYALFVHTIVR